MNEIQTKYKLTKAKALDRATFLKVRGIARLGTKPQPTYTNVFKKRKKWVDDRFQKAVSRFTHGL